MLGIFDSVSLEKKRKAMSDEEKVYPYYMRLNGTCLKVNSKTDLWEITLPPDEPVACRSHVRYSEEEKLNNYIKVFRKVSQKEFMSFLTTFYHVIEQEHNKMKTG